MIEGQCFLVFGEQLARLRQKHLTILREPQMTRRTVDQTPADTLLQHLQFLADDRLHGSRRLRRLCQAAELDGKNEQANALKIYHMKSLCME
ncbi:hypothetical protein D3C72_1678330 [compost metagenome]